MISINVIGTPGAQGSKSQDRHGRMFESSKKVAPWRAAVAWSAVPAVAKHGKIDGPVVLCVDFVMKRPLRLKNKPYARPTTTPDSDKLERSTNDALTQAGVWEDDSRVVGTHIEKRYEGDPKLPAIWANATGAWIRVWSLAEWESRSLVMGLAA